MILHTVQEHGTCLVNTFSGKGSSMTHPERQPPKRESSKAAGGIFIAIGMLLGAVIGVYAGQPSAGMVIGLITGLAAAILVWAIDSKRNRHN